MGKMKVHVEFEGLKADFEGDPDEVIRSFLTSVNEVYPTLELVKELVFHPDLSNLAESLIGIVQYAPDGLLFLAGEVPAEEAIIASLVGSYVGYRLGKIDNDTDSVPGLSKITGKAPKTISNQLACMIDNSLVERIERGRYRITSLGIKRFELIAEKLQTREKL